MVPRTGDRIIDALVEAAAEVLPLHFNPDCCLNATAVAIEALDAFRVRARATSVDLVVWNPTWARLRDEHGAPKSEEEAQAWAKLGGWSVGVDTRAARGPASYPGHVVASARGFLVDLAAGQFSRPERDMPLPEALAIPLPLGFLDGKAPIVLACTNGARLFYWARPDDRGFVTASGFQRSDRNRGVAALVMKRMIEMGAR